MKYEINGKEYNVIIIKKSNKNTYIRIDKDLNIVVTTNYLVSKKYIERLLIENNNQILKMINSKNNKNIKNEKFYYLGKNYDIIIVGTFDNIQIIDDKIYVKSMKALDKWVNKQIKDIFLERLNYWYDVFEENISYPTLKYRNMKTRWGVCNRKNVTVTLNTNLIKYDISCLDYVIIHELSHYVEFNHSNKFWNIVSKYCKDYKKKRKELKE